MSTSTQAEQELTNQIETAARQKVYNSALYRSKIKRMVERVKRYRGNGLDRKIARGLLPQLGKNATNAQKLARIAGNDKRLNMNTIHFFANTNQGGARTRAAATPETTSTPAA